MSDEFKAFKINFGIEKAVELIDSEIRSKHWDNFSVATLKLDYVPFWFFSYEAFEEKENKAVSKHVSGKKTFNARTNNLSDFLVELTEKTNEIESIVSKQYPSTVVESKISNNEVKEIVSIRIASSLGFAKENIKIFKLELFFVPLWITFVTVENENYKIRINANTGKILGSEKVPEREKGFLELSRETIEELKNPGAWLEYSKKATSEVASLVSKTPSVMPSAPGFPLPFDWRILLIIITILFLLAVVFRII